MKTVNNIQTVESKTIRKKIVVVGI